MLTVVLRRRQKFWFLTKEIAVLTTSQHQKVEITKNNPEMRIFMGGVWFRPQRGRGVIFLQRGGVNSGLQPGYVHSIPPLCWPVDQSPFIPSRNFLSISHCLIVWIWCQRNTQSKEYNTSLFLCDGAATVCHKEGRLACKKYSTITETQERDHCLQQPPVCMVVVPNE